MFVENNEITLENHIISLRITYYKYDQIKLVFILFTTFIIGSYTKTHIFV